MRRLIHFFIISLFFITTISTAEAQVVRVEIRAEGAMQEANGIADCQLGPTGYENYCTCCGRSAYNTDCSDCNGPVDVDMYGRFTVGGVNGTTYQIGGGDGSDIQGCGTWRWFNGSSAVYNANRNYGDDITVALGGRENDNGFIGFCGPDDGNCFNLYWASSGNTSVNLNASGARCPTTWHGVYTTNIDNCSSDGSTNDYRVRWSYRYYFVSGFVAGSISGSSSVTACTGYDPPSLTSSGFTTCYNQRNWQLNNGDISGATGATYNPGALNTQGTYTYRTRYRYITSFAGATTDVYSSNSYTYTINPQPTATATKSPNVATVCAGATLGLVSPSGADGAGTCNFQYRFSTNNGVAWSAWSTTVTTFTAVAGTNNLMEIRRVCNGASCNANPVASQYSWAVVADPVAPTIAKDATVNVATVCAGQTLTVTTSGGSGGTGTCDNQYRYSTDNAVSWTAWSNTVPSFAAITSTTNRIQSTRNCDGTGCNSNVNEISWAVVADPVAPAITKSPNVVAVCEGQTLTVTTSGGTGGTGTCANEYRYNDGSGWSGWSTTLPSFTAIVGTSTVESRRSCDGLGCDVPVNSVSWSVVGDPVAPTIVKEATVNTATVCAGQTLTISVTGAGSGGTGTCNDQYRYSTNDGGSWTAWSNTVPSFAAVTSATNRIQSTRNCDGSNCNSNINEITWEVIADPVAPTITRSPNVGTVCEGQTLTVTPTGGGTGGNGTCNNEYRYDDGSGWSGWSTTVPSFTAIVGTSSVESRRDCDGLGCNSNVNSVSWTVTSDPVAPTIAKDPSVNVATVCAGQTLTITTSGGSGGFGTCNNQYRYSTNDGSTWTAWNNAVPSFAAVTSASNRIQSTRNCSGNGCNSNIEEVSWEVVADPVAPTITRSPNASTICEGQTLTVTPTGGGTGGNGTCNNEYRYDDGSGWSSWSTTVPSFTAIVGTSSVESRRDCDGVGCNSNVNSVSWTVTADPVAPTITKSPNVATVCEGQTLTVSPSGGSGGVGSCNNQYRYSTDDGSTWTAWSNVVPSFAAVTSATNRIQSARNCNGNGCNSNIEEVSWVVVADPVAPTMTKSPNVATVCEGQTLTITPVAGSDGTGTCTDEYRYSTNNGGAWTSWSTTVPSFAAVTSANNIIESRRNCDGNGCNSNVNSVSWVVVADPVAPTMTKSPNVVTVCAGATLTITPAGGTGGTGTCNNEYRYSTDNGGSWSSWSTTLPSFASVTGTNLVESRRDCNGDGCNSNVNSVSWTVIDDPIAPTITKSPNVATVCEGQTITVSPSGGSGGNGTCNNQYRYSTDDGSTWTAWSNTVPSFAAVTSATNRIQSARNCDGSGCNSNIEEVSWVVAADPVAPTMTKSPDVATVCEGQTLTITPAGGTGGTGTCDNEYRYSTNNGVAWTSWSTTVPSFAAVISANNIIESRRNCDGNGCNTNVNSVSWVVIADPIAPTMTKSPNVVTVCEGQTLTITPAGGSGGTGTCNNEYRYSTDNGGSWSSWSTTVPSFASVTGTNLVESRRNCDGEGCNSNVNQVSWTVNSDNTPATNTQATPPDACSGEQVTLSTDAVAGLGATIGWYTGTGGTGTFLGSGASININPSADNTYYAYVSGGVCPTVESNTGLHNVLSPGENVALYTGSPLGLVEQCEIGGWTYYGRAAAPNDWIFAVRKNGNTVTFQVDLYTHTGVISSLAFTYPQSGTYLMRRYWNMAVATGSIGTPIDIKFYYDPADLNAALALRNAEAAPYLGYGGISLGAHPQWFKTNAASINGIDGFTPSLVTNSWGNQWDFNYDILSPNQYGTENGVTFVQFNGLASLSGGTGGTTFGQGSPALPVELVSFFATPTNSSIILNWTTASELNNDRFEINRSSDGITFSKIGEVTGRGTTNEISEYVYEDKTASPGVTYYYQLRQVDFDGTYDFSDIVSAKIQAAGFVVGEFAPNPTTNSSSVIVLSPYEALTAVTVYNVLGQQMMSKVENIVPGQNIIELKDLSILPKGNYLININTGIDQVTKKLVVVD